jgi:DNA-binding XRE family transcriptional regulator
MPNRECQLLSIKNREFWRTLMSVRISQARLAVARGKLIQAEGRDITWEDFAQICGLSPHTVVNIKKGHTGGSSKTIASIVSALRKRGVAITAEDLLVDS